jgi:hypothetical protein
MAMFARLLSESKSLGIKMVSCVRGLGMGPGSPSSLLTLESDASELLNLAESMLLLVTAPSGHVPGLLAGFGQQIHHHDRTA